MVDFGTTGQETNHIWVTSSSFAPCAHTFTTMSDAVNSIMGGGIKMKNLEEIHLDMERNSKTQ